MKKMMTIWIFLAVCLFGTILFIGIRVNKEYQPYRDYEADLVESASLYINMSESKLSNGDKKKIKIDEMLKVNVLSTNKVNDDECEGYVDVKKSSGEYEYKAYIKCKNYISVDYKE